MPPALPLALDYATPAMPRVDLRTIAIWHRATTWCVLAYMILIGSEFALFTERDELRRAPLLLTVAVMLVTDACAVMLSLSVYKTAAGVIGGILTLVPCLGLFILLVIIVDAARILRQHGVRVGLMGASLRDIPRRGGGRWSKGPSRMES